jgi:hypothetical protein
MGFPPGRPLPSFPRPPPPPPPTAPGHIAYALPPPPPPPGSPGWGRPDLPGPSWGYLGTRAGIEKVRQALGHYRIVVGLGIASGLLSLLLVALIGAQGLTLGTIAGGGGASPSNIGSASVWTFLAVAAISGILALLVLIMTIVSWAEWRSGLRTLLDTSGQRGEEFYRDVLLAHRFYTATVVAFLLNLVAAVVIALAVVAEAFATARGALSGSPAPGPPTVSLFGGPPILSAILASVVVSAVLNIVLYYCAGRSVVGSIRALVGDGERSALEKGRWWILFAAVLTPVFSVASLYSGWATVGLLAPPVIFLVGYTQIIAVYDRWLVSDTANPPPSWRPVSSF